MTPEERAHYRAAGAELAASSAPALTPRQVEEVARLLATFDPPEHRAS